MSLEPTLLQKLRSPLGTFEHSDAVNLVRAQGLCDQAARAIEEAHADNKRLRDELTAALLERDALKRLSAATPDLLEALKRMYLACTGFSCIPSEEDLTYAAHAVAKAEGRS